MFVKMDCIVTVARCDLFCMLEEIGRDVGRLVAVCNMIWVFLLERLGSGEPGSRYINQMPECFSDLMPDDETWRRSG